MRAAVCDNSDFRSGDFINDGRKYPLPRRFQLAAKAVHVVLVIFRLLAVSGLFIMAAPASEVGRQRMIRSWQRPVSDPIPIDVAVALKFFQSFQIFGI